VHAYVVVTHPRRAARAALAELVAGWGWTVVGEAKDGLEAVTLARTQGVDVLLVDGSSPGLEVATNLDDSKGRPVVVRLLERPQEHAAGTGVAVLKGVPADRLRLRIEDELRRRRSDQHQAQGPVGKRDE
jgi:CheY-like chemotaxis protein